MNVKIDKLTKEQIKEKFWKQELKRVDQIALIMTITSSIQKRMLQ